MRPLNPIDFIFLSLEKRQQPMHVAGLFLFKLPDNASPTFVHDLVQDIRQSKAIPIPPFNQVLNGLLWDTDEEFDLDHHFRHISLPAPGRIRELLTYISQEHSTLIDRAKPLWMCHVIEGIEDNRFAMYFKIHHAMVDGVAGMRLIEKSLSHSPDESSIVPPWCVHQNQLKRPEPNTRNTLKHIYQLTRSQFKALPAVFKELSQALTQERGKHPDYVSTSQAPASILNQRVSSSRRFAAQSFELQRLRLIAKALNATLNDIILAICAGAIRAYLITLNQLPKRPLIAMVPASIRTDDSDHGNQITMILANLATHKSNALDRLATIQGSMQHTKNRFKRMTTQQILNYSALVYGPAGINILSGLMPKYQAFNLVISNVPGPSEPLYWNGAMLDALYPVSIVLDGQALNITMTSYLDKLEVGITACRQAIPRVQSLLGLLEDEIQTFEQYVAQTLEHVEL
ncbi:wax ester/triacylglycerol synthase family O-acyltransferase [Acinetobacter qingfengensis]|uniref:diacylglycerol O-acyltransferase n=1 Tax=Acinetobacter qingfengensis TaxID=1262585 RepID=A0A1E7RFU4_9GAMM|nr:wax ester/triacylglycerol synthase family O-acyltransferase [Acinetobacter qingfengensis]KAA8732713.1 wax ester/triacylglycerol synthase family O-acyltransferase [Acinetobacter qingfengensis]OEY98173.1 acetyltransferase [Acinetobacter qingfengensis]